LLTGLQSTLSGSSSESGTIWDTIGIYGYPVLILLIVGAVAALGPALRAIRMSPAEALRDE
ncbi:MAG: hypothetical protein JKY51_03215, partial [Opitutaceae bacterium]|nr:hypothetical protein [Opitutaceae bacterium]